MRPRTRRTCPSSTPAGRRGYDDVVMVVESFAHYFTGRSERYCADKNVHILSKLESTYTCGAEVGFGCRFCWSLPSIAVLPSRTKYAVAALVLADKQMQCASLSSPQIHERTLLIVRGSGVTTVSALHKNEGAVGAPCWRYYVAYDQQRPRFVPVG